MTRDLLDVRRLTASRRRKHGEPAGTLRYTGEVPARPVTVYAIDYDEDSLEDRQVESIESCNRYRGSDTVTWINVDGVHDLEIVRRLGTVFDIHDLTLEDIVHPHQRPKVEEYDDYIFVVLQMMHYDHETSDLEVEQVSLVFGRGFVLSFQESMEGDAFEPVRTWIRENRGRIRRGGADFLAYALIDVVVDHYMNVLEGLGEHIELLEDEVVSEPSPNMMQRINLLRRRVMTIRRAVWPLRDVVAALHRSEAAFIAAETDHFFRDVYDHAVRTTEIIESAREILSSLSDLHMSALTFRMNEIMKMLAIIATIFLPLSFIAGVYGMNFDTEISPLNMPELGWYFGYPFALALMAGVAATMILYFRHRGWM